MSNNKEVVRFSLFATKECLERLLATHSDVTRDTVVTMLDDVNRQLESRKRGGLTAPRKLSPYNYFVKEKLPEVAKKFPDIDNRARMAKVSEMWRNLDPAEKQGFKPSN
jgi:uncharacterized protein with von Willebrand factor type A (vWA) domain